MTRKKLKRRVEFWRARLCPDWRVSVMRTPHPDAEEPFVAVVQSDLCVEEIRVYFKPELLEWKSLYDVDRVIVHELLHPLLDRVLDQDEVLQPMVAPPVWDMHIARRRDDMEQLVNRLAHVIVAGEHDDWPIYFTGEGKA